MNSSIHRYFGFSFGLLLIVLPLLGCGSTESANTVHLSGSVTFEGKPLKIGMIVFEPDPSKGNNGPQGHADIVDGKFDTRSNGKPTVVGAVIVRVTGGDGVNPEPFSPFGKLLFEEYISKVEISREAPELKVDVPGTGSKR